MLNNLLINNNYLANAFSNLEDEGFYIIKLNDNQVIMFVSGRAYKMNIALFNSSYDLRNVAVETEDVTNWRKATNTDELTLFCLENQFILVQSVILQQLKDKQARFMFEDLVDYGVSLRSWAKTFAIANEYGARELQKEQAQNEQH